MKRRILASMLSLAVAFSLLPTVALAADFEDVNGHWGQEAIERWAGHGVVEGSDGLFNPDNNMTRAEMAAVLSRLLGLTAVAENTFADVPDDAWYAEAILKCAAAGIMEGDGTGANPEQPVSRQEAAVMLARALGIRPTEGGVSFDDGHEVAGWAAGYVRTMADKGIVNGVGDNRFAPLADINRASVVTILHNSISGYANEAGATISGSGQGITLVAAADVTVTGAAEDLLVAPGAADSTVAVEAAAVSGTLTVTAEGATVTLASGTETAAVEVAESAAGAQVVVEEGASVGTVTTAAPSSSVTVSGTADKVETTETAAEAEVTVSRDAEVAEVAAAGTDTTIAVSGTVESVTVSDTASDATVTASSGAQVGSVTTGASGTSVEAGRGSSIGSVTTTGADTTVSGSGTVSNVEVAEGSTGASVTTTGTTVENNSSGSVSTGTGSVAAGDSITTSRPSGGGSSSSGDSSVTYYTVTFQSDGAAISSYSVAYGSTAAEPAAPTKEGYTFIGWSADGGTTTYDFSTAVTADLTLTAQWQANEYTVTYVMPDGTSSTEQITYGNPVTYPDVSGKDGFTWAWYTDSNFTTPASDSLTMPASGLTVYGQWTHTASGLKGEGTQDNPFLISTADEFAAIGSESIQQAIINNANYYFVLANDIDYKPTETINYFNGTLDGKGHSIQVSADGGADTIFGYSLWKATFQDITFVQMSETLVSLAWHYNAYTAHQGEVLFQNITFTSGKSQDFVHDMPSYGKSQFGSNVMGKVRFINCTNEVSYNLDPGTGDYMGIFIGNYVFSGMGSTCSFIDCVNKGNVSAAQVGFFTGNSSQAASGITLVDSQDYDNTDANHAAFYISGCRNEGIMLGTKKSMAIMSVNNTTVNDEVNDAVLADEAKFTGAGNMQVPRVNVSLAVNSSGEIIIKPSSNTEIKDYAVNYSVSTSYRDVNGNSYGSWYFSVTEVVDAVSASTATFDRVTRVMLDTEYDETAAEGRKYADLAAEGKSYDDYGNEYIIVTGEDGDKTAVLNSKQLAENSSWPDAVVWCGSTPNYTLFARNELGQSIGSIKYSVTEIGADT